MKPSSIPLKPTRSERAAFATFGVGLGTTVARVEAPGLVMTLGDAVARASVGAVEFSLDRACLLVVPRGGRLKLSASAVSCRLAWFAFGDVVFRSVVRTFGRLGVKPEGLAACVETATVLPRTAWVHECVHRYAFEREALKQRDNSITRFLEVEVLKELFFLIRDRRQGADRASVAHRLSPPIARAVAELEARLFQSMTMTWLASTVGVSESSLLRGFRRELGRTPAAYRQERRLDEALALLRGGSHSVAQAALAVGYENPTAFGQAFRRRFGQPPSTFRPALPARHAP